MILAALALQAVPPPPLPPCPHGAAQCESRERHRTPPAPPGWDYISDTRTGTLWFIHSAAMLRSDGDFTTVRIRVRMDHSRDRTTRNRVTSGLLVIGCRPRIFHWEDASSFAADGRMTGRHARILGGGIAPDTLIDAVWQRLCPASETGPAR